MADQPATTLRMTRTQQRLADAIRAAVADGPWEAFDGRTIRFSETLETRPFDYGTGPGQWGQPTYQRHLFLTVVTGSPWSIILRVDHGPLSTARDTTITFTRAFEVIADPERGFA